MGISLLLSSAALAQTYTALDLGIFDGRALNSIGQVAGFTYLPNNDTVASYTGANGLGMTTLPNPTNTNLVVDAPHKDLRRARSAMMSLAPTTTGSATAIALIYPELKGKLNGHAVRVPALNASLTDCVFEMQRETSVEEVNALFAAAAQGPLAGILGYETRPLVSADYARDTRSSIVDALSTMVTDGTLLKVYAWYDNEMGYACRMVDLACHMETVGI